MEDVRGGCPFSRLISESLPCGCPVRADPVQNSGKATLGFDAFFTVAVDMLGDGHISYTSLPRKGGFLRGVGRALAYPAMQQFLVVVRDL